LILTRFIPCAIKGFENWIYIILFKPSLDNMRILLSGVSARAMALLRQAKGRYHGCAATAAHPEIENPLGCYDDVLYPLHTV
jgi:hypothetical protein